MAPGKNCFQVQNDWVLNSFLHDMKLLYKCKQWNLRSPDCCMEKGCEESDNNHDSLQGLPWWCSGQESACQCRGHGFELWSRKIPHAMEQQSPRATTTEARMPRAHTLQQRVTHARCNQRKPAHRNKDPMQPKIK